MDITTDGPTLVLSGDFDVRSTSAVRAALHDQIRRIDDDVVVDLSGVEMVDLTALRVLGAASLAAARSGQLVRLRGCTPAVRRMLHISHLIRVVDVEREPVSA